MDMRDVLRALGILQARCTQGHVELQMHSDGAGVFKVRTDEGEDDEPLFRWRNLDELRKVISAIRASD